MQIPGHLAVASAQYRLLFTPNRQTVIFVLLASLFPDLVDKFIGYIWGVMPNGRHYAHNLFSLSGVSAVVALIWGPLAGLAWFTGYVGHLLADSHTLVPWFFPLKQYHFKPGRLRFEPAQLIVETALLLAVLLARR